MRSHRRALVLSFTLLACGGGKDPSREAAKKAEDPPKQLSEEEELAARGWIAENTPALRERLAAFEAIATVIDERSKLGLELPSTLPSDLKLQLDPKLPGFNAGLLEYEQLRLPCLESLRAAQDDQEKDKTERRRGTTLNFLQARSRDWLDCGACLAQEKHPEYVPGDPLAQRECYEKVQMPEYLLVVRTLERVDGEIVDRPKDGSDGTFVAGGLVGEIVVVRIADATQIASFSVVAESSDNVGVVGRADAADLKQDLSQNFTEAVDRVIAEQLSGRPPGDSAAP